MVRNAHSYVIWTTLRGEELKIMAAMLLIHDEWNYSLSILFRESINNR